MTYHIYKRNKIWYISISKGVTGERIKKSLKTKNKQIAQLIAEKAYNDYLKEKHGLETDISLKDAVDRFL